MSSIRSVLLHLDHAPSAAVRLDFARDLAARHGAALSAMFTGLPPRKAAQRGFPANVGKMLAPANDASMQETLGLLDTAPAGSAVALRWLQCSADPIESFCAQALYADLLVLGQHHPSACVPEGFVESVLINTDQPALVLPFGGDPTGAGASVAIGWNATPQATRAVRAALPWLRSANQVHILQAEDCAQRADGALDIAQYLQLHGIAPTLHRSRHSGADIGGQLLAFTSEVAANLLVMGCYGHSRSRELMLGGASRSVLRHMTVPVLMAH
jgi:nucleotide-binding universal stress UspA family protein